MNPIANGRAALLMMLAMTAFTFNDAITKWVATDIGVGQTMLLRGLIATSLLAALAWMQGAFKQPRLLLGRAVTARSLFEIGGTVTFLLGLPHLPISNVSAIYQALPLVVTLGAALFLGEPVGWRRWSAILVGFLGVMLIVRPGMEGFTFWSVIIVVSLFFSAARDLVTRRMPRDLSTFGVAMLAALGVTLFGGAMIPFQGGFQPVSTMQAAGVVAAALLLMMAYLTLIAAMRSGEISFVAPFRYVALIVALTVGYVAFDERPDSLMLVGSAIVVASGAYAFYRERVRAAAAKAAAAAAAAGAES